MKYITAFFIVVISLSACSVNKNLRAHSKNIDSSSIISDFKKNNKADIYREKLIFDTISVRHTLTTYAFDTVYKKAYKKTEETTEAYGKKTEESKDKRLIDSSSVKNEKKVTFKKSETEKISKFTTKILGTGIITGVLIIAGVLLYLLKKKIL